MRTQCTDCRDIASLVLRPGTQHRIGVKNSFGCAQQKRSSLKKSSHGGKPDLREKRHTQADLILRGLIDTNCLFTQRICLFVVTLAKGNFSQPHHPATTTSQISNFTTNL